MKEPLRFEVELTPSGARKIVMNGVDISRHVRKVDIHAEVDKATTIALEFIAVDVSALGDLAREYALPDAD